MTTKKRIQELLRKRDNLNGTLILAYREMIAEFTNRYEGFVEFSAVSHSPGWKGAGNEMALGSTVDGGITLISEEADGKDPNSYREVADLDLNTLELLCSGISDMEERIDAGDLIIEPAKAWNIIKIKDATDNLLSRAQIHGAFVSLLNKYSRTDLSFRPKKELETFGICTDEELDLDGSTIDKVTWNGDELRFYFNGNTDDYDYFSTFSFEGLKAFYLGLRKALESGRYNREED